MTERRCTVLWTPVALDDLERMSARLRTETPFQAEQILDRIIDRVDSLTTFAGRGRRPPELESVQQSWFEVIEAPWRILYWVLNRTAEIHGIFDGRRDLRLILIDRVFG